LVFIPKCGKKVLTKAIAEGLKQIICDICNKNTQGIMAMEVMPDDIHLIKVINAKPTHNPCQIMNRVKGRVCHFPRTEFPEVLKLPTLWTPSYFVTTANNICTETVKP
jgi:putative transposase